MMLKIIINFIIYIEGSMCIFIVYVSLIGPLFHFDYLNFKGSIIIRVINFSEIKNMAHLVMLVIFHVNVIDYLSNFQFTTHLSYFC
jgi:hypothetical protein